LDQIKNINDHNIKKLPNSPKEKLIPGGVAQWVARQTPSVTNATLIA